jgi:hypothetical protein
LSSSRVLTNESMEFSTTSHPPEKENLSVIEKNF